MTSVTMNCRFECLRMNKRTLLTTLIDRKIPSLAINKEASQTNPSTDQNFKYAVFLRKDRRTFV